MRPSIKDKRAKLIGDIAVKCIENNISFILKNQKYTTSDGNKITGYFIENYEIKIACRVSFKKWFDTLVHESCHLDQYLENLNNLYWHKSNINIGVVNDWLNKKSKQSENILNSFKIVMELELDCAKRSVKKYKKYDIPLDNYIKGANAYLFSYVHAFKNRKWYPMSYYKNHILVNMPNKLLTVNEYFNKYDKFSHLFQ